MLVAHFEEALDRLGLRDTRVLVAVSGGRDSIVLLHLMLRARERYGLELVVGHVDHGLRAEASEADAGFVEAVARGFGLPCEVERVDPGALRSESSNSRRRKTLEEAARDVRRAALAEIARRARCTSIALAHHAGDQAETVLLRLLRGTGPDGLAAMAERSVDGFWLRPLLGVLPEALETFCAQHEIVWREDESNRDPRFARNLLRHEWIPGLAETFNPQLLRAVSNLAEAQRMDLDWIEDLVAEAAKERIRIGPCGIELALDGWEQIPEALARRLARRALVAAGLGRDVSRRHLERMLDFLRRGRGAGRDRRLEFPRGVVLRRRDDHFALDRVSDGNEKPTNVNATVLGRD